MESGFSHFLLNVRFFPFRGVTLIRTKKIKSSNAQERKLAKLFNDV